MKIAIAGASGLIGSALAEALRARGDELTQLDRPGSKRLPGATAVEWEPQAEQLDSQVLARHDAVFCLNGYSLMEKRWNREVKQLILDSRVKPAALLAKAIAELRARQSDAAPQHFLCANAVGY